ncbi:MAG: hypothetical protein ACXABY_22055 [Candidatus Thorarchaeota archaeon]|jgi:hypothetical protein
MTKNGSWAEDTVKSLGAKMSKIPNDKEKWTKGTFKSVISGLNDALNPLREGIMDIVKVHKPFVHDSVVRQICGVCGRSRLVTDREGKPYEKEALSNPWHDPTCSIPRLDKMLGIDRTLDINLAK